MYSFRDQRPIGAPYSGKPKVSRPPLSERRRLRPGAGRTSVGASELVVLEHNFDLRTFVDGRFLPSGFRKTNQPGGRPAGREGKQSVTKLGVAIVLMVTSTAWAEDPCLPDVTQFCSNIKPGAGRVTRCLEENQERISQSCRTKLEADKQQAVVLIAEFTDACQADIQRVCPSVQPGGGRHLKCLVANDYALTPRCAAEVAKLDVAREKVLTVRNLCKADAERLCSKDMGRAGDLLACLQANENLLSAGCKSADPAIVQKEAALVDTVEEMTSQARAAETVEILQGLNSVAFSRNQIAFSFDYFQGISAKPANLDAVTFNPLLVFGRHHEFAVALKVPVAALFPTQAGAKEGYTAVSGVAGINTAFAWAFFARGSIRQFFALALQWNSASEVSLGGPWVITPVYSIAVGLAGWVSLSVELSYSHSFGSRGTSTGQAPYPEVSLAVLRPILVFNLPAVTFIAIDTKLGWDFIKEIFVPVMRFQAGKLIGRERNVSIGAWFQLSLNTVGKQDTFNYGVGTSLSYFFDW